jgi:small subunit ribosomal protein S8
MALSDPVSDALTNIKNAENMSKPICELKPASKLLGNLLKVMQKEGYIGEYEFVDDSKSGMYRVRLKGQINKCGPIKPRYSVKYRGLEKYEKRYLPSRNMGILVISTQEGIMTHEEAKKRRLGGKLLAFVY